MATCPLDNSDTPGRLTCEPRAEPVACALTMQRGGTNRFKLHTSEEFGAPGPSACGARHQDIHLRPILCLGPGVRAAQLGTSDGAEEQRHQRRTGERQSYKLHAAAALVEDSGRHPVGIAGVARRGSQHICGQEYSFSGSRHLPPCSHDCVQNVIFS